MMHQTILSLIIISSASAFVMLPTTCHQPAIVRPSVLFAEVDAAETPIGDSPETMGEVFNKQANVRCPDCDLCDGSGRYV
jgi:hypothetical protein